MVIGRSTSSHTVDWTNTTIRAIPPGAGVSTWSAALLQLPQRGVRSDPVEPKPKFGPALEVTERAPGPQIRPLNHIFRVACRAQHAVAVHQQLRAVRPDQDRELLASDRHGHALFRTGLPGGSGSAW